MKKRLNKTEPHALAKGVFKKRMWPWLLIIVGALCPIASLALYAKEYFIDKCLFCDSFAQHLSPNLSQLITMVIVCVVLALLAVISFIFPKRSFTVTACKIIYKKGRKETRVPFSTIDRIDTFGSDGIVAFSGKKKIKFGGLKNRKEMYDALLVCMQNNAKAMSEIEGIAVDSKDEVALSKLAEGKIRYFKKLLTQGNITVKQFDDYVEKALETKK